MGAMSGSAGSSSREEREPPKYVWGCTVLRPVVTVDEVREAALADMHEACEIDAENELKSFLEGWNAKQSGETWEPDYRRAVILGGRDTEQRQPGCQCHQEAGDSPCRVHGEEE